MRIGNRRDHLHVQRIDDRRIALGIAQMVGACGADVAEQQHRLAFAEHVRHLHALPGEFRQAPGFDAFFAATPPGCGGGRSASIPKSARDWLQNAKLRRRVLLLSSALSQASRRAITMVSTPTNLTSP